MEAPRDAAIADDDGGGLVDDDNGYRGLVDDDSGERGLVDGPLRNLISSPFTTVSRLRLNVAFASRGPPRMFGCALHS